MTSDDEQWKPIEGFPMYEISSMGRLKSYHRNPNGKILRINTSGCYHSYPLVVDGVRHTKYIHRLVANAFLGPKSEGQIIRHLDGDVSNNTVSNLAYGTQADNMADAISHGTFAKGETHVNSKLTERKVRIIRGLRKCGFDAKRLAEIFNVNKSLIYMICRKAVWKHVT